jgi:hypothetical protein
MTITARTTNWQPACNGNEVPFLYNGERWLYVWDRASRRHGYLHMATDIVYADYRDGHREVV